MVYWSSKTNGQFRPAVRLDGADDCRRKSYGGGPILGRDSRGRARANALQKCLELRLQWFHIVHNQGFHVDHRTEIEVGHVGEILKLAVFGHGEDVQIGIPGDRDTALALIVEREIGRITEYSQPTIHLHGQARGDQIGHGAVLKFHTGIGDVFMFGQYVDSDRIDPLDRRLDHVQHNVNVMDHHVGDDADVGGAKAKRADPLRLDIFGNDVQALQRTHHRIKAFGMSDRQQRLCLSRAGQQRFRLFDGRCQRFFNEYRDLPLQQCTRDAQMMDRRHSNSCSLDPVG
jgi:hypothetical protein